MEATGSAGVTGAIAWVVIVGAAGLTAGVVIGVTARVIVEAAGLTAGVVIVGAAFGVVVVVGVAGSDGAATGGVGVCDASGWVDVSGGVGTGGDTVDKAFDTADSGVWEASATRAGGPVAGPAGAVEEPSTCVGELSTGVGLAVVPEPLGRSAAPAALMGGVAGTGVVGTPAGRPV